VRAKEVLQLTGITRIRLERLVKQGKTRVSTKPNGRYIYNVSDMPNKNIDKYNNI